MTEGSKRWGRVGLLIGGVLVALFLLEGLFRLLPAPDDYANRIRRFSEVAVMPDSQLGHRLTPGSSVRVGDVDYEISPLGTRGPNPDGGALVVLGDSVTMGWGVPYESTYAARLASELELDPGKVVNAGVLGYGSEQEVGWLQRLAEQVEARVVILGYYPNDPDTRVEPSFAVESALWSWAAPRFRTLAARFGWGSKVSDYHRELHREGSASLARVDAAMSELGRWCDAKAVACVVVLLPELSIRPYPLVDVHARVGALARSKGLRVLDLAPVLEGVDPRSWWVSLDDAHPNAQAHSVYAREIAAWLRSESLLAPLRDN